MFSQSGFMGSYFRVIQEGNIEQGNEIQKVHSEENSMSLKILLHFYLLMLRILIQ